MPGPPPVSRCPLCSCILHDFNLLSGLLGQTLGFISCNTGNSCTCALPIGNPEISQSSLASVVVALNKDHAKTLLGNRPNHTSCLLVSSRAASGLQHLRDAVLIHKYESNSPLATAINVKVKPSPILVFRVPPDAREMGSCHVLAQTNLDHDKLDMVFRRVDSIPPS